MANAAIWTGHAHQLGSAEHLFVKINGGCSAFDDQIRRHIVIAVGNRFYFTCHLLLLQTRFRTYVLVNRQAAPHGREPWRPFDSGSKARIRSPKGSRPSLAAVFSMESTSAGAQPVGIK